MSNVLENGLSVATKKVDECLKNAKKALIEGNLQVYSTCYKELEDAVKDKNTCRMGLDYQSFMASAHPMTTAVAKFFIKAEKITEEKDKETGMVKGLKLDERNNRLNLEGFCKWAKLPTDWANKCNELRTIFALREKNIFEMKPSDLAKESFFFVELAKKKMDGETPDSNTQIVRLLQEIIDDVIGVDSGTGKSKYRCTNHDIAFMRGGLTKYDKRAKATLATLNERQFKDLMLGVFAHALGESYKYEITTSKKKTDEVTPEVEVSTKKDAVKKDAKKPTVKKDAKKPTVKKDAAKTPAKSSKKVNVVALSA